MPKKVMNDIIVDKKSIRQIPISSTKKQIKSLPKIDYHERFRITPLTGNRQPLDPKFAIWLIAVICLVALFFGLSMVFSSATLKILPRQQNIMFTNDLYIATLNPTATSSLAFEVLKVKKDAVQTVEAIEEKSVNQKATGKIIIYNNFSSASQRLINNTRFESADGRLYRINSSIVVPGTKSVNGKIVPGSIEATVVADQPGDKYNLKVSDLLGDFKIPGFKGSPRYDSFYARLKEDITGGFIGKQRVVADSVRTETESKLKSELRETLIKELYLIKPDNYFIFDNSYSLDYVKLPDVTVGTALQIKMEGTINSVVFNNFKFASYLAGKKITDFDYLPVKFIVDDNFKVSLKAKDNENLWRNNTIEIFVSGPARLQWLYDSAMIKQELAGKNEAEVKNIIKKYQNTISSINVSFWPIWTKYLPDNLNKIEIEEINP